MRVSNLHQPCVLNTFDTMIDVEKFSRKLHIKKFFLEAKSKEVQVEQTIFEHSGLKNKPTFNPKPYSNKFIDVFKNMVQEDIRKIKSNKKRKAKAL